MPAFDLDAHLRRIGLDGRAAELRGRIARGGREALAAVDEVVAAHADGLASRDDLTTTLADVFGLEPGCAVVDAAWRTIARQEDEAAA